MTKSCLNLSCFTFILLTIVLSNVAHGQEGGWDNWNDLGGFEDFPSFDESNTKEENNEETPNIDLPIPSEVDSKTEAENISIENKANELKVDLPKKVPDIQIPTTKTDPDALVAITSIEFEAKKEAEAAKKAKAEKEKVTKSKAAVTKKKKASPKKKTVTNKKSKVKEVVLKTKDTNKGKSSHSNRRLVEEGIATNSKIENLLNRDVDLEEAYNTSPLEYTRTDYNYKQKPHQFFIDHKNEANAHLPRNIYQKEYSQLLFSAIEKEDIGALRSLISNGADINSRIIATGYSASMYAVKKNKIRALRYLITKGADLNLQDNSGKTPLHLAISEGKVSIFNILVASGADPFVKDNSGKYPVDYATDVLRNTFITSIARVSQDKNLALIEFSGKRSLRAVSELLSGGALIDSKDKVGDTALIKAVKNSDMKMVKYLLSQGANPLIVNNSGMDALEFAKISSDPQIHQIIHTVVIRSELESGMSRQIPVKRIVAPVENIQNTHISQNLTLSQDKNIIKKDITIKATPLRHSSTQQSDPTKYQENYLTAFDIMESSGQEHKGGLLESLIDQFSFQSLDNENDATHFDTVEEIKPGIVRKTTNKPSKVEPTNDYEAPEIVNSFNRFLNAFKADESTSPTINSKINIAPFARKKEYSTAVDLIPDEIQ